MVRWRMSESAPFDRACQLHLPAASQSECHTHALLHVCAYMFVCVHVCVCAVCVSVSIQEDFPLASFLLLPPALSVPGVSTDHVSEDACVLMSYECVYLCG